LNPDHLNSWQWFFQSGTSFFPALFSEIPQDNLAQILWIICGSFLCPRMGRLVDFLVCIAAIAEGLPIMRQTQAAF
jgi:hypothetical protein